jgi:prepilin-type N-terminal cleavage/methylation domain-containing protein
MKTSRKGFTILELIIAIAVIGLLLVGLNYFVFSMGELWGRNNERRLFEQHVRGVSRYIERELRNASMPPSGSQGLGAFAVEELHPSGALSETLLTFELREGSRLLNWPDRPLPEVVCAMQARSGQGLFLLWHSRLEEHFNDDPPREVLISPFGTGIAYDYYDEDSKRWTTEKQMKRASGATAAPIPRRIRLTFAFKGYTQERVITLPWTAEGLPNF